MEAIDILMEEHRVIERVLDALEVAAGRLHRGEPVRAGFFLEVAEFATGFADGCHHRKEEGVLFHIMEEHGGPARGGPIEALMQEHVEGRALSCELRSAATALERGDDAAAKRIVKAARGYAALLREHIEKEDEGVFPMAARLIPETEHDRMMAWFAEVEDNDTGMGAHARYLAMAGRLEREVGAS